MFYLNLFVKVICMKNFLQQLYLFKLEDVFKNCEEKCKSLIAKHPELYALGGLAVACFLFLFLGLGSYPLLDVDETRYAVMAKELVASGGFNCLQLNGVPFLEKPPLYFWFLYSSIKLFGDFTPLTVRLPIALSASFLVFFTYFTGKKIISRKFGLISALTLLTSAFFLILAHVAIIDMLLAVFIASALYSALLSHFCEPKYKKYCWWYFYLFMGVGFLAKGILALVLPTIVIFIYNFLTGKVKDIFKPINFWPGILIFLVIILPWHVIMYSKYGYLFINEYFIKHHFSRFINSESIGRERPLLYFVPVFFLGFLPWSFVFISFLFDGCKKLLLKYKSIEGKFKDKLRALVETNNNEQKLLLFALVYFLVLFVIFSISSTKLPTYILPVFPAAALLTGYYWWRSDNTGEYEKSTYVSTIMFSSILIVASLVATIVVVLLPLELQYKISDFKAITLSSVCLLGVFLVLRLNTKKALSIFLGYVFTMFFVIALAVFQIFNFVYANGQNEIVKYSQISSNSNKNSQLITFDFAVKPSVLISDNKKVVFITDEAFETLDEALEYKEGPTFVIAKNKNFQLKENYLQEINKRLRLILLGERYSLFISDPNKEYSFIRADFSN